MTTHSHRHLGNPVISRGDAPNEFGRSAPGTTSSSPTNTAKSPPSRFRYPHSTGEATTLLATLAFGNSPEI
jgi:hypothetical protein